MMKKIASLTTVFLLIFSMLLCGCDSMPNRIGSNDSPSDSNSPADSPSNSPDSAPSSTDPYAYLDEGDYEEGDQYGYMGDVLNTYWFNFAVEEAYTCSSYGSYTAPEGKQLLVVAIAIKSTSRNDQPMYDTDFEIDWDDDDSVDETYAYPITTSEYAWDVQVKVDSQLSDEQLLPEYELKSKAIVTGELVYEVPELTAAGEPIRDFYFSFLEMFENEEQDGDLYVIYFEADEK